jgi:hypothetical protein
MGADLANNFATAEAACLVGAALNASDEKHKIIVLQHTIIIF